MHIPGLPEATALQAQLYAGLQEERERRRGEEEKGHRMSEDETTARAKAQELAQRIQGMAEEREARHLAAKLVKLGMRWRACNQRPGREGAAEATPDDPGSDLSQRMAALQAQLREARALLLLIYRNSRDMGEVFEVHHFPEEAIEAWLGKTEAYNG